MSERPCLALVRGAAGAAALRRGVVRAPATGAARRAVHHLHLVQRLVVVAQVEIQITV